jgi:glycosyltransferase involved in cell wall biosynthesis
LSDYPDNPAGLPAVSVVIAAFMMERWNDLLEAVESVRAQTVGAFETVVVIDHNPALLARAQESLSDVIVTANMGSNGASASRNVGVSVSRGDVVAFLDDDAVASPTWLEALLGHFTNPDVVGVGGRLIPLWAGSRPRWFPYEFDWAVGASYRGMPEKAVPVRNVWSGNMAIRRSVFDSIGGFRSDFGKVGRRSRPEDTDLCLRAAAAQPGGTWVYEPSGIVGHKVPLPRATLRFFLRRCFNEGSGKAALAALNGRDTSTSAERAYIRRVLPQGFARCLRDAAHGNSSEGLRSIAIAGGFSAAVAGFIIGEAALALRATGTGRLAPAVGRRPAAGEHGDSAADARNSPPGIL